VIEDDQVNVTNVFYGGRDYEALYAVLNAPSPTRRIGRVCAKQANGVRRTLRGHAGCR
jgi:hypothetical protein